jgi:hypothetical protein
MVSGFAVYAQETEEALSPPPSFETAETGSSDRIFLTFSQGATASWLTRIIRQTNRSNFVFRDFLPGLYVNMELQNINYVIPALRLAAYYPLFSGFNEMSQKSKTPLHYSADALTGVKFRLLNTKYLRLNAGPALHLFFLNADRWNYFDLGIAAVAGIELPLTARWTLLADGNASLDNGNLGGNRYMEPFDIAYQYQVDIGFRYSKKMQNVTFLFGKQKQESDNNEDRPLWR